MGLSTFPVPSSGISISDVRTANSTLTLQQTITSSGAVTIPAGVTRVFAIVIGGGGGGGGGYQMGNPGGTGGGGGGGVSYGWTVPSKYAFIGAGGTGGTTGANSGTMGNPSVFGSIVAGGGGAGLSGSNSTTPTFANVSQSPYFMSVSGSTSASTSGAIPGMVLIANGGLGGSFTGGGDSSGAGAAITNDVTTTSIRQYTYGWGEVTILPGSPNITAANPSPAYYGNSAGANHTSTSNANGRSAGSPTYAAGGGAGGQHSSGGSGTGGTGGSGGATSFGGYSGGTGAAGSVNAGGGAGGGAGALANGSNGTASSSSNGGNGGAGGSGGGGGGGAGGGSNQGGTGGNGGVGCVMLFY
jgi:hypothetical protein